MKRLFTLLLPLLCIGTLSAQQLTIETARETAVNYLREEGYAPKVDEDEDVVFKLQGTSYCIHIAAEQDGSLFIDFYTAFSTEQPYQKILEGCNRSNHERSVVKYYAQQDAEGGVSYVIAYERFHNAGDDFLSYLNDGIALLPQHVAQFQSEYE